MKSRRPNQKADEIAAKQAEAIGGMARSQMKLFQALGERLDEALGALREARPPRMDSLSLADVIAFFVDHRADAPDATASAIIRKSHGDEYLVTLAYLDNEGRPLVGRHDDAPHRAYLVERFDEELADTFGGKDVIIFH